MVSDARICEWCGQRYWRVGSRGRGARFCSHPCCVAFWRADAAEHRAWKARHAPGWDVVRAEMEAALVDLLAMPDPDFTTLLAEAHESIATHPDTPVSRRP